MNVWEDLSLEYLYVIERGGTSRLSRGTRRMQKAEPVLDPSSITKDGALATEGKFSILQSLEIPQYRESISILRELA